MSISDIFTILYNISNVTEQIQMRLWFYTLKKEDKHKLTKACRLYAYWFDKYINFMYANKPYPKVDLVRDVTLLANDKTKENIHDRFTPTYNTYSNPECDDIMKESPFVNLIGTKPKLSTYIKEVNKYLHFINDVFISSHLYYLTQLPLKVYRGLCLPKGKKVDTQFIGITSVTTSFWVAKRFAFTLYNKITDDGFISLYDESKYDSYIIEILLPLNTCIIPMGICTIQDEKELIVISQGTCTHTIHPKKNTKWNGHINIHGEYINPDDDKEVDIKYTPITAIFNPDGTLPTYNTFKVSSKNTIRSNVNPRKLTKKNK